MRPAAAIARDWERPLWCGLLSLLLPGLGQVRARAWTLGMAICGAVLVTNLGFSVFTRLAEPAPLSVAILAVGGTLLLFVLYLGNAIDAVLRCRRQPDARRAAWWQSTWLAALAFIVAGIAVHRVVPLGWEDFSIRSTSAAPTLLPGDVVVVDKRDPASALTRGAVVVFLLPGAKPVPYVKRIIGLPGDRVQLREGVLYLNGRPVPRTKPGRYWLDDGLARRAAERYRETLPDGTAYDILQTTDQGALNNTPVYTVPDGDFFVLGDDRDNSADSRMMNTIGYIPAKNLIGRARVVLWAHDWGRLFTRVR